MYKIKTMKIKTLNQAGTMFSIIVNGGGGGGAGR